MNNNTGSILKHFYPAADFTVLADRHGIRVEWRDPAMPCPTAAEIAALELPWAKAKAQERRARARLAAQTGGFRLDGATYASDQEESIPLLTNAALSAQLALAQGAEAVAAFEAALGAGWRDTAGVGRITTATGLLALHAAFVAHGAACDRHSQALKGQIEAASSVAELDAIDLATGWPEQA